MPSIVISSIRGKDLLLLENYTYAKDKNLKSGEIYWRCTQRRLKCTAKVFTVGSELTISRSDLVHNHEENIQKLNRQVIGNACKRKAEEDISEKPSKIIRKVLSINLPEEITTTDINCIRKNMYHSRRNILPGVLPKNLHQVHQIVDTYSPKTSRDENFLLLNCPERNIICFSCETNIRVLHKMNTWYVDGTFSYCTKYFYQLFTIHGLQNGHYVPLVYCLLAGKTTETYINLFSLLKSKVLEIFNILLEPCEVFADFEKAIHKAILHVWPNTKINGCRFHLHQAWNRKIQSLGLIQEYSNKDSEVGKWLRHTFGLTYLRHEEVADSFAFDLMSYKPENELLDKYADYLLEVYVEEDSQFPPNIWAEENPSITRTTNACESFHSRFNSSFYSPHPSIYIFIEKLKEFQIDTYIKIQSLHIQAKTKDKIVKSKLRFLKNITESFQSGQMTRLDFIKCASTYSIHK